MSDVIQKELTPEGWEAAKSVLLGEHSHAISLTAAAKAANVSRYTLQNWIKRSREQREGDEPWVKEIAEVYDQRTEHQAGTLEDVAWKRAMTGVRQNVYYRGEVVDEKYEVDNKILMRLLEAKDEAYKKDNRNSILVGILPTEEILQRFRGAIRVATASVEAEQEAIEGTVTEVTTEEGDF